DRQELLLERYKLVTVLRVAIAFKELAGPVELHLLCSKAGLGEPQKEIFVAFAHGVFLWGGGVPPQMLCGLSFALTAILYGRHTFPPATPFMIRMRSSGAP